MTTGRAALHVLEDVQDVGTERAATRIGFTPNARRGAAQRLGMTPSALDRAIYRARNQRDAA